MSNPPKTRYTVLINFQKSYSAPLEIQVPSCEEPGLHTSISREELLSVCRFNLSMKGEHRISSACTSVFFKYWSKIGTNFSSFFKHNITIGLKQLEGPIHQSFSFLALTVRAWEQFIYIFREKDGWSVLWHFR